MMAGQVPATERFNEAIASLSTILTANKLYKQVLVQGCHLVNSNDGFLYVAHERIGHMELAHTRGVYKSNANRQPYQYDWGVPLYTPYGAAAFLGVGTAYNCRQLEAEEIALFGRFAVVASWALYYASMSSCKSLCYSSKTDPIYDQSFYTEQIIKYHECKELVRCFLDAESGKLWRSRGEGLDKKAAEDCGLVSDGMRLSAREKKVLKFIAKGYSNNEVADLMNFSMAAVKYHLGHIFTKLDVKNRIQAVTVARQEGLI